MTRATPQELDRIEGLVRFAARCQIQSGAIIDPIIHGEHQYATPYFAHALGVLLHAGRVTDLVEPGIQAMDWATRCFEVNRTQGHRVFYTRALVHALPYYEAIAPTDVASRWRVRLGVPVSPGESGDNNWSTYYMAGEWARVCAGLIERKAAVQAIETKWTTLQRSRIVGTLGNLYHDVTSDPDTLSVEAVGRGNLLALSAMGYDGPSAGEIRGVALLGSKTAMRLQDPTGQAPCNGRTDNHVWVDAGYGLAFTLACELAFEDGDLYLAGQFRRAATLALESIERWRRGDGEWAGSYFVTKNHFAPALRVGYQTASQYSNYNGSLMHHLAGVVEIRKADVEERPAPCEAGGYAFALDDSFDTAFANAGGMHVQIDLRGDIEHIYNPDYWCALGIVRFARSGWDSRLGPSDGIRIGDGDGVSFAPAFYENGAWIRLASVPERYRGHFSVTSASPSLVECVVEYRPRDGCSGPVFRNELRVEPGGVLCTFERIQGEGPWGVTLPLLADDGVPLLLRATAADGIAATRYVPDGDQQCFLVLNDNVEFTLETSIRSSVGDFVPLRATTSDQILRVFVYPRNASQPSADEMRAMLLKKTPGVQPAFR